MRRTLTRFCEIRATQHLQTARGLSHMPPETLGASFRELHLALSEFWSSLANATRPGPVRWSR